MIDPLVEQAQRGDAAALEEVLSSVAPSIHRFGLRMCKDEHEAADVLQDTLLSIATHLGEFEGRSSLTSWAFTLARTACSRRRRGRKNQPAEGGDVLSDQADPAPSPEQRVADGEIAAALGRALDQLSEEHREVILLRDVEGLTAPDAAASLGISVDALKSRLHRARAALREALRPILEPAAAAPAPSCPDVLALWSRKLDGDLSSGDCAAMEKHAEACASCGPACDALRRALLACQREASAHVRPEVAARVREAVRALRT